MSTGRIEFTSDYRSEQKPVQPPPTRTIRFCLKCGRHDGLGGTLNRRHWWNGSPCNGKSVVVRYALVSDGTASEHQRLRDAVVEAAKAWRPKQLAKDDPRQSLNPLAEAIDALVQFESLQEKKVETGSK